MVGSQNIAQPIVTRIIPLSQIGKRHILALQTWHNCHSHSAAIATFSAKPNSPQYDMARLACDFDTTHKYPKMPSQARSSEELSTARSFISILGEIVVSVATDATRL